MKRIIAAVLISVMLLTCVGSFAETLTWWDQFMPLVETYNAEVFGPFEAETGIHIDYTNYDAATIGEALDLAAAGAQSPDISSYVFSTQPIAKLTEGRYQPMTITVDDLPEYLRPAIVEGYTMYNGELYSFPTFAINHQALMWRNTNTTDKVPTTLEEMREVCKELTDADNNFYAVALPLTDTTRMNNIILYIASMSGGNFGFNWKTGIYDYTTDEIKTVFKFFVDLWEDGSVHPASTTLKTRTVRERWMNDEIAYAFDGCWYPGSVKTAFGVECLSKLGVSAAPVIDLNVAAEKGMVGAAPSNGAFYISSSCKNPEAATKALTYLLSDEYSIALADAMDQPPINAEAIAKSKSVAPVYVEACQIMASQMGLYPEPLVRNPEVGEVYSELMSISPNVGDIYVGYITGAISDWEAALQEYTDAMNAELDRAIDTCKSMGANVDRNDWVFPNYVQGESYTSEKYAELN